MYCIWKTEMRTVQIQYTYMYVKVHQLWVRATKFLPFTQANVTSFLSQQPNCKKEIVATIGRKAEKMKQGNDNTVRIVKSHLMLHMSSATRRIIKRKVY